MRTQLSSAISAPPQPAPPRHSRHKSASQERDLTSESHVVAVPFVKRIDEEIAPDQVSEKHHPRVAEWWVKIQARPAFARANIGPFATTYS